MPRPKNVDKDFSAGKEVIVIDEGESLISKRPRRKASIPAQEKLAALARSEENVDDDDVVIISESRVAPRRPPVPQHRGRGRPRKGSTTGPVRTMAPRTPQPRTQPQYTRPQPTVTQGRGRPPRNISIEVDLNMECVEEALSPYQIQAAKRAEQEYKDALAKIKSAQARIAAEQQAQIAEQRRQRKQQWQLKQQKQVPQPIAIAPQSYPNVGAILQTSQTVSPYTPPAPTGQAISLYTNIYSPAKPQGAAARPPVWTTSNIDASRGVISISNPVSLNQAALAKGIVGGVLNITPHGLSVPRPGLSGLRPGLPVPRVGLSGPRPITPVGTVTPNIRRRSSAGSASSSTHSGDKREETGNWVPLDEYYYGKKEGDPTYREEKGEFRFKCWYCHKMLYNNLRMMMHMQGHIDSEKQQNLDLSDLTQCKHCFKQFDTPFDMQCHVERVHQNKGNVLVCRICDKDHDNQHLLRQHMRNYHSACEMPYICQLCNFRSSVYSDVVDHFKKRHDSSQHTLCLYCLRVFKINFSKTSGWGLTQNYYQHLQKHGFNKKKKCLCCTLTFLTAGDIKSHKAKDHLPNHKGAGLKATGTSNQEQVMIQLQDTGNKSGSKPKSLNAPSVSKVRDLRGIRIVNTSLSGKMCFECQFPMEQLDHFKRYIECTMCRYATTCNNAYSNHMISVHSGNKSMKNKAVPKERPMEKEMFCLCGFSSTYGNSIANHLVFCSKRTTYTRKPVAKWFEYDDEQEEFNPFEPYVEGGSKCMSLPSAKVKHVVGLIPNRDEVSGINRKSISISWRRSRKSKSRALWNVQRWARAKPSDFIEELPPHEPDVPDVETPGKERELTLLGVLGLVKKKSDSTSPEPEEISSERVTNEVIDSLLDAVFPAEAAAGEVIDKLLQNINDHIEMKEKEKADEEYMRAQAKRREKLGSKRLLASQYLSPRKKRRTSREYSKPSPKESDEEQEHTSEESKSVGTDEPMDVDKDMSAASSKETEQMDISDTSRDTTKEMKEEAISEKDSEEKKSSGEAEGDDEPMETDIKSEIDDVSEPDLDPEENIEDGKDSDKEDKAEEDGDRKEVSKADGDEKEVQSPLESGKPAPEEDVEKMDDVQEKDTTVDKPVDMEQETDRPASAEPSKDVETEGSKQEEDRVEPLDTKEDEAPHPELHTESQDIGSLDNSTFDKGNKSEHDKIVTEDDPASTREKVEEKKEEKVEEKKEKKIEEKVEEEKTKVEESVDVPTEVESPKSPQTDALAPKTPPPKELEPTKDSIAEVSKSPSLEDKQAVSDEKSVEEEREEKKLEEQETASDEKTSSKEEPKSAERDSKGVEEEKKNTKAESKGVEEEKIDPKTESKRVEEEKKDPKTESKGAVGEKKDPKTESKGVVEEKKDPQTDPKGAEKEKKNTKRVSEEERKSTESDTRRLEEKDRAGSGVNKPSREEPVGGRSTSHTSEVSANKEHAIRPKETDRNNPAYRRELSRGDHGLDIPRKPSVPLLLPKRDTVDKYSKSASSSRAESSESYSKYGSSEGYTKYPISESYSKLVAAQKSRESHETQEKSGSHPRRDVENVFKPKGHIEHSQPRFPDQSRPPSLSHHSSPSSSGPPRSSETRPPESFKPRELIQAPKPSGQSSQSSQDARRREDHRRGGSSSSSSSGNRHDDRRQGHRDDYNRHGGRNWYDQRQGGHDNRQGGRYDDRHRDRGHHHGQGQGRGGAYNPYDRHDRRDYGGHGNNRNNRGGYNRGGGGGNYGRYQGGYY